MIAFSEASTEPVVEAAGQQATSEDVST